MSGFRQNKVESLLKRDLSSIFQLETKGMGINEMVSVTVIRISPDLSFAKVYLSIFPSTNASTVIEIVKKHGSQIRGILGKKIGKQVRIIPELAFYVDDSLDYIEDIDTCDESLDDSFWLELEDII